MVKGMDQGGQVRGGRGETQRRALVPGIAGVKWEAMAVGQTLGKLRGPKPTIEGDP